MHWDQVGVTQTDQPFRADNFVNEAITYEQNIVELQSRGAHRYRVGSLTHAFWCQILSLLMFWLQMPVPVQGSSEVTPKDYQQLDAGDTSAVKINLAVGSSEFCHAIFDEAKSSGNVNGKRYSYFSGS